MEMIIGFPGEAQVEAHFGSFTVKTDQPPSASAPTPFDLFLASIGTCAGIYVIGFCRKRNLPTEGLRIVEQIEREAETGMVSKIALDIQLPPGFPEKYRDAVIQSAQLCAVKKHIERPPAFDITTTLNQAQPA